LVKLGILSTRKKINAENNIAVCLREIVSESEFLFMLISQRYVLHVLVYTSLCIFMLCVKEFHFFV
jgi:hypothetical protein